MQRFIYALNSAVQQRNWYAALSLALTLPDICGRLENPHAKSENRFVAWWDKYLLAKYSSVVGGRPYTHLAGGDAYSLRCAFLHEGVDETVAQRARVALTKFHFITPPPRGGMLHCNQLNSILQLQVDIFCNDISQGVTQWVVDTQNNPAITVRMAALITIYDSSSGRIVF